MNLRRILLTAAVAAAPLLLSGRAQAQCGPYGGYGYGYAWDMGRLYGVLADNVPYFAAFPPVYYSQPVPRTYGYSPFAYPPGVMTPEVIEPAAPLSIDNPYYSEGVEEAAPSEPAAVDQTDQTTGVAPTRGPLVILNPYVSQPGGMSGMASKRSEASR